MGREQIKAELELIMEACELTVVFLSNELIIIHDGIDHQIYYHHINEITIFNKGTTVNVMIWLGENKQSLITLMFTRKESE